MASATASYPTAPTAPAARLRGRVWQVTHDLFCLQQSLVNVVFVGAPGASDRKWVLVDAGLPFSAAQIASAAAELYGFRSRPAAIVLTHGHFDHVGAVRELADRWDAPVFAHEMELPYLTGRSKYPPPDPAVGGGSMSFLSRFYPRGPINLGGRIQPLPHDQSVPGLDDWRWIPTAGHTAGHVSFFRERDSALIAGDAFVTVRQESALAILAQQTGVQRPPAYYTQDWQAAYDAVKRLTLLQPEIAITGHGQPMYGTRLQAELERLARDWKRIALPSSGRYVCQPVIANRFGTVAVPPPVYDRQLVIVAALATGVLLGWLALRSTRASAHDIPDECPE